MGRQIREVSFMLSYRESKRDGTAESILLIPPQYKETEKEAFIVFQEDFFFQKEFWKKVAGQEHCLVVLAKTQKSTVNRVLRAAAIYLHSTYQIEVVFVAGKEEFLKILPKEIDYEVEYIGGNQEKFSIGVQRANIGQLRN